MTEMDFEKVKANIPTFTSEKLCEMIVCNRYFNIYSEISIMCMEELAIRRSNGSTFPFENHIDKLSLTLPKLDFSNLDLRSVLSNLIKK